MLGKVVHLIEFFVGPSYYLLLELVHLPHGQVRFWTSLRQHGLTQNDNTQEEGCLNHWDPLGPPLDLNQADAFLVLSIWSFPFQSISQMLMQHGPPGGQDPLQARNPSRRAQLGQAHPLLIALVTVSKKPFPPASVQRFQQRPNREVSTSQASPCRIVLFVSCHHQLNAPSNRA